MKRTDIPDAIAEAAVMLLGIILAASIVVLVLTPFGFILDIMLSYMGSGGQGMN